LQLRSYADCICTSTSHFWTLFSESPHQGNVALDPHIRLMVDVLLTTDEAFCSAEGGVSCSLLKPGQQEISEKKHD
jgi:hypothetical protein